MFRSQLTRQTRQLSTISRFPQLAEISAKDLHKPSTPFGHGSYFLERSAFGNLPVYTDFKQGIPYTEIRKIKGDIVQLRNDLQEVLEEVPKKNFKVVMESKKLLIKGVHKQRLEEVFQGNF
ncbi:CYFA0S02e04214g1_1 [Cyberlindnera fabianii]|uniref:Large ribosomal subunit protein mL49 n=1 Tax=Cyberlindnera fabianii TaxID=36022 RepID=A0A061ATF4_CYBFA|nr:hypothetical protein BON22_0152 [Cyberlindnera fabianii]CDR38659.1 CYFA0S02e04214g1_1 [Cyberlindnera fabianii]